MGLESALAEKYEVTKAYFAIKRRYSVWNLEATVFWLIKNLWNMVEQELVTRD